jgi:hypothetical protein
MHWFSPLFYMEAKFGPLEKKIKATGINRDEIFFRRTAGYTIFAHKKKDEILEKLTVEAVDEKLRRYKSKWLRLITRKNNK